MILRVKFIYWTLANNAHFPWSCRSNFIEDTNRQIFDKITTLRNMRGGVQFYVTETYLNILGKTIFNIPHLKFFSHFRYKIIAQISENVL